MCKNFNFTEKIKNNRNNICIMYVCMYALIIFVCTHAQFQSNDLIRISCTFSKYDEQENLRFLLKI